MADLGSRISPTRVRNGVKVRAVTLDNGAVIEVPAMSASRKVRSPVQLIKEAERLHAVSPTLDFKAPVAAAPPVLPPPQPALGPGTPGGGLATAYTAPPPALPAPAPGPLATPMSRALTPAPSPIPTSDMFAAPQNVIARPRPLALGTAPLSAPAPVPPPQLAIGSGAGGGGLAQSFAEPLAVGAGAPRVMGTPNPVPASSSPFAAPPVATPTPAAAPITNPAAPPAGHSMFADIPGAGLTQSFAPSGLMGRLAPGVQAARSGEGGYMAALRGTNPIGDLAGAGGRFLGTTSGSALASEAGLLRTGLGVAKGSGLAALASLPVSYGLQAGGNALMKNQEDGTGVNQKDVGQTLAGAGDALPVTAALGSAAVALGAAGPVGWGIAGLGALGYGIYKAFSNDDASTLEKEQSAAGAKQLDEFATAAGIPAETTAYYAKAYADLLEGKNNEALGIAGITDPADEAQRTAALTQLRSLMTAEVGQQRAQQQSQASMLAQQRFAQTALKPYADNFIASNSLVDQAYRDLPQQYAALLKNNNNRSAMAAMSEAGQAPFQFQQQQAQIAQLSQQLAASQQARSGQTSSL